MAEKDSEMSLDEVLSSIKKMVVDLEPPVLELTDMVADDGSIVDLKKKEESHKSSDMGSFLKIIQENSESFEKPVTETVETKKNMNPSSPVHSQINRDKDEILAELVQESITRLLKDWLNEHLPLIVSKAVEHEVKKLLNKN